MTSSRTLGSFTPGPISALPSPTRGGRRMRESCTYGVVRGALSNERPYRDHCCVRRATPPSHPAVVHELSQRDTDAFIFGERCADLPRRRTSRAHSLPPNPRRTASPICPDLIYDRHKGQPSVLTSPNPLSTLHRRFACARLSQPCLPGSSSRRSAALTTVAFDQSGPRRLGISDPIAEPEGPTFISYKVARRRLDRSRFLTQGRVEMWRGGFR